MQAQSWTAPTLKYTTDEIPSAAYFYHVDQSMFLTKGTTWGTHAALTSDASTAFLYEIQDQGNGVYKLYCAAAANTKYLGRSTESELYTDYNNQAAWSTEFEFYKAESGFYHIRTAATSTNFGANLYTEDDPVNYGLYEMGWNSTNDDVDQNGASLGTNLGIFMLDPTLDGLQLDWAFVTEEVYQVYSAQSALYNKLVEAYEMGYTEEELSEYSALLSSEDTEALATATAAVDQMILDYAYNHATPENPYDVTSVIVNPTFEGARSSEPAGWTDEYSNMLIQNNKAYYLWDDETEAETTEYGLNNFAQNWTSSGTDPIAASNIYQVISNLPQGTYRLTADCIATSASSALTVSGASLYAISGVINYQVDIDKNPFGAAGASYPHRYTLEVTHFGGDLTIGYGFTPGYVKWFGCDNFKLYYCGPVDNPGLLALSSTYATAKQYYEEYDYSYIYSEATYNTLGAELENADAVMAEADSEACTAEAQTLNALIATIQSEIAAYSKLSALVEKVTADITNYENITELSDQLADMKDEYAAAYEDKTATVEQIESWVEGYDAFILEGVKAAMPNATEENPVEVTILGKNMNYAENSLTEGWTVTTGTVANQGAYKVTYNVGEVWSNTFSCMQTIEGLPAGKYILKAEAFYRTGNNDVAYNDYISGTDQILTYMVLGSAKALVVNQAAGAIEATAAPYNGYVEAGEGTGIWVPNSMESASYAFRTSDVYECELSGYLAEDGALTFGFRNDELTEANAWSVWSNVRLFYCGKSNSELYNQMLDWVQEASAVQDQVVVIAEADNKINNALGTADQVTASSSEEDILNAIHQLKEAIDYANEGIALVTKVTSAYTTYSEMAGTVTSSDEAFPALLEEVSNAIADEEFVSNEKMNEWLTDLAKKWTAYIQYDHLGATKEAPEDITAVIVNPSFDQGTNDTNGATGWTFDYTTTNGHIGYNNTTQQQGSGMAYEYWAVNSFSMQQTIVGLAEGYYHLTVNGLYRAGNNTDEVAAAYAADPEGARDMTFFANTKNVAMKAVYDGALTEDPAIDGQGTATLNGVTVYLPNTMIAAGSFFALGQYTNELDVFLAEGEDLTIGLRLDGDVVNYNWCVFDDFTISYLGNGDENMPDAINALETQPAKTQGIYDLTGRRVSKAQKGIYIINGRKVVIK